MEQERRQEYVAEASSRGLALPQGNGVGGQWKSLLGPVNHTADMTSSVSSQNWPGHQSHRAHARDMSTPLPSSTQALEAGANSPDLLWFGTALA